MLNRLPDELLVAVLDSLAAPAYAPRAYEARQGTLRALCLTSRRLHRVAQPVLFRHIRIHERTRLDQVRDVDDEVLRAHTKVLQVEPYGSRALEEDKYTPLEAVAAGLLYPNVEELRVEGRYEAFDMQVLDEFPGLRRLSLFRVVLDDWATVRLPRVEQLRLEDIRVDQAALERWLGPAFLPSVKAIYLSDLFDNRERMPQYFPKLTPAILAQLDFVQTRIEEEGALQAYGRHDAPPFLFELHREPTPTGIVPRHALVDLWLYYEFPVDTRLWKAWAIVGMLADHVEAVARGSDGQPMRTLFLPACFANRASTGGAGEIRNMIADTARRLERLGVPLSFADAAGGPGYDLVSPAFWAEARKMRDARETGDSRAL
ncbi:hypothetical protein JCM10450v2_003296 [Rhodotorula kratochvilovae]